MPASTTLLLFGVWAAKVAGVATPLALSPALVPDPIPFAIGDQVTLPLPGKAPIAGHVTSISLGKLFVAREDGSSVALPRHHLIRAGAV